MEGNIEKMKEALKNGADVNCKDRVSSALILLVKIINITTLH